MARNYITTWSKPDIYCVWKSHSASKVLDVFKQTECFHAAFVIYLCIWLQMNGTGDGEYVFYTGKQNYQDFARVDLWRNQR